MADGFVELGSDDLLRACKGDHVGEIDERGKKKAANVLFLGLGQKRFEHGIELGIQSRDSTQNVFVIGLSGPAGFDLLAKQVKSAIEALERKKVQLPAPPDWCFVFNFDSPRAPLPIPLKKGRGESFKKKIKKFLKILQREVPEALQSGPFKEERERVQRELNEWMFREQEKITREAAAAGIFVDPQNSGQVAPLGRKIPGDSAPMTPDEYSEISTDDRQEIQREAARFQGMVSDHMTEANRRIGEVNAHLEERAANVVREIVERVFNFGAMEEKYGKESTLVRFLEGLKEYSVSNHPIFVQERKPRQLGEMFGMGQVERNPFLPFEVNLLIDNSKTETVPVVAERVTSASDLLGFIDRVHLVGATVTDHTRIVQGAVARANGGFLILNVRDLLVNPQLWEMLKRVIKSKQLTFETPLSFMGYEQSALQPIPIPIRLRVILFGSRQLLGLLAHYDEEFLNLFGIRAEIAPFVERSGEQVGAFGAWMKWFTDEEKILSPSKDAIGALVEHAGRLAENQEHLSTDFGVLESLIKEAALKAEEEEAGEIKRSHVEKVLRDRFWRSSFVYEHMQDLVREKTFLVAVKGNRVGQINGLYVSSRGDISFGFPSRITTQISLGKPGFSHIQYDSGLGGSILGKAGRTLEGLLEGKYARDVPIAVKIFNSFEQSYNIIEGDSASLAQFLCMVSQISDVPLKQSIAITGSVNLHGDIQPIGGVNEKIEGFFDVCRCEGLTGEQGVAIPWQNRKNLMLRRDVVDAVHEKRFHIWTVETIGGAIELFTGMPEEKFDAQVREQLQGFWKRSRALMRSGSDDREERDREPV